MAQRGPITNRGTGGRTALAVTLALAAALACASPATAGVNYHGGPVIGKAGETGRHTATIIYWAPDGYSYPSGYKDAVETFVSDVAADSGKPTNPYAVTTQYTRIAGSRNGESYDAGRITYDIDYGGSYIDTNPYPPDPLCVDTGHPLDPCIGTPVVAQEMARFTNTEGLSADLGQLYIMVLPPNVSVCDASGCTCVAGANVAGNGGVGNLLFVMLPYPRSYCYGTPGFYPLITDPTLAALALVAHESIQSIVDPASFTGWHEGVDGQHGSGVSDLCIFSFSNVSGSGDAAYNTTINGHRYLLQDVWSNQDNACVGEEQPPSAAFSQSASAVPSGTVVSFDGSGSSDPDGYVDSYAWGFGDGATATGASASHAYARAGTYTATLTVADDEGWTATATRTVSVSNRPPTAGFTVAPTSPVAGEPVTLTSTSGDPDGVLTLAWDLAGLGTFTGGSGASVTHTFPTEGTYQVSLRVTDNDSATDTTSKTITVAANQPPTASFTVPSSPVCPGAPITLDGSASGDPEGRPLAFAWDLDGDGTYETATGASATTTASYVTVGEHPVSLRVTDAFGHTATATRSVTVASCEPPPPPPDPGGDDDDGGSGDPPPSNNDGSGGTDPGSTPPLGGGGGSATPHPGSSGSGEPVGLGPLTIDLRVPSSAPIAGFVDRGLRARVACSQTCRWQARVLLGRRHARQLGMSAAGPIVLARASGTAVEATWVRLHIRPARHLPARLRRLKRLAVTVSLVARTAAGEIATGNRAAMLVRGKFARRARRG